MQEKCFMISGNKLLLLVTAFCVTFYSCSKPSPEIPGPRPVKIFSAEGFYGMSMRYQADSFSKDSIILSIDFIDKDFENYDVRSNFTRVDSYRDNNLPILNTDCYVKPSEIEWYKNHTDVVKNLDLAECGKQPYLYDIHYLKIKSVKLTSTNSVVGGRSIGEDLSDLYYCDLHPALYSYPEFNLVWDNYMKTSEKLTLDKIPGLNLMMCTRNMFIRPLFKLEDDIKFKVAYKAELVIEDEFYGERTFDAECLGKDMQVL